MNIDDEIDAVAEQAWHNSTYPYDAWQKYYTLNGAMRELHDAWIALCKAVIHELVVTGLKILDMMGM